MIVITDFLFEECLDKMREVVDKIYRQIRTGLVVKRSMNIAGSPFQVDEY